MRTPPTNFVQRSSERLALFLIALMIGWFAFSARAHAVNPSKRYDFNHDGYPDYVVIKSIGNNRPRPWQTVIWYLQNNRRVGHDNAPEISSEWVLVDAADFNGDGYSDYVLFNFVTGQTKILYLQRNRPNGEAPGPTVPNGWKLHRVGEFNGDGKPDYVILNKNTQETQIWYMNKTQVKSRGRGPTLDSGWDLRAAADFNGDGLDDYLLFGTSNAKEGRTEIWYIEGEGRKRVRRAVGPTVPLRWFLGGAADFNKDGHPDYLIYQDKGSPRKTGIWYLNDNVFVPPPLPRTALGPPIQSPWFLLLPSGL